MDAAGLLEEGERLAQTSQLLGAGLAGLQMRLGGWIASGRRSQRSVTRPRHTDFRGVSSVWRQALVFAIPCERSDSANNLPVIDLYNSTLGWVTKLILRSHANPNTT